VTISGDVWLRRFAEEVGDPSPTPEQAEALLTLAGIAAHASERIAAPLSAWLGGRAGMDVEDARLAASNLAQRLEEEAALTARAEGGMPPSS
jgi:hypothetical protein